jgi:hypothetical protein
MFPLSRFRLRLRSFTFSCSFSPLPSDLTHRRSFGLRARCRTSTYYSIAVSYLITGPLFRIRRRAMSLAGLHSFQLWFSFSPLTTFPLRSVYCRSLEHESYKYPSPGFVETRQPRPLSLSLSFSSRLCLRVLRLVPIASDPFRLKPNLCIKSSSPFAFHLLSHSCCVTASSYSSGSGDNNPREPPLVAHSRVLVSGRGLGFILVFLISDSRADARLRLQYEVVAH